MAKDKSFRNSRRGLVVTMSFEYAEARGEVCQLFGGGEASVHIPNAEERVEEISLCLSKEQLTVLKFCFIHGFSERCVAGLVGKKSRNAVHGIKVRAIKKLREASGKR